MASHGARMKIDLPPEFLVQRDCSLTALINFTAKVIKEKDEPFRKVQKRVRARVRDHQQRGKLPAKEAIKPEIFFSWALGFKAYQALTNIAGLPRRARVEVAGVGAVVGTPMVSVVRPPETHSALLEAYVAETSLNQSLLSENSRLKSEIQSLKNEVAVLKRKRKTLSDKLSSAGKKGGRGNER